MNATHRVVWKEQPSVADQVNGGWAALRGEILDTPAVRAEYERTRQSVLRTRQLLCQLDAERERAGLTRARLAARMGADPSVVRRLFASGRSNPTLKTVLEIADVLGMEVELRPIRPRRAGARRRNRPAVAA